MLPDISIVICAYTEERWHHLVEAVESAQRQSITPREIIVVIDNNVALFERASQSIPGITLLLHTGSRGAAATRGLGVAKSSSEFVACLDDDAVAEPNWLELLSSRCDDPQVLGVGGITYPNWEGERPQWFPKEFYWVIGCSYSTEPTPCFEVRNLWAGCMCIRREVFEAVGNFRTDIGHVGKHVLGGEETEFCIRAKQHYPGKKFLCEPRAAIHHFIPRRRATWRYFINRCYSEGLSKALITRYVGTKDSLSTESTYTLRVLPAGVLQNIADGFLQHDTAGFLRAGAIVLGLTVTTLGYIAGMFMHSSAGKHIAAPAVRVEQVEPMKIRS